MGLVLVLPPAVRAASFCDPSQRPLVEATFSVVDPSPGSGEERGELLICTGGLVVEAVIDSADSAVAPFPFASSAIHRGAVSPEVMAAFTQFLSQVHVGIMSSCRIEPVGPPVPVHRYSIVWFGRNGRTNAFELLAASHTELPVCSTDTEVLASYVVELAHHAGQSPTAEVLAIAGTPQAP